MKARCKQLACWLLILLAVGLAYLLLYHWGLRIPCVFYETTGLYCPGCGVTRMLVAMSQLEFAQAFRFNPGVFILLPVFGVLFISMGWRFIRYGTWNPTRWQSVVIWLVVVILLLFSILRNLPAFAFLAPA